jgi:hypothetical protein
MAYLRGEIDEDKFRDGVAMYGVTPGFYGKVDSPNRIDAGFSIKLPDDFFEEPAVSPSTEEQIKLVNKETEAREKATEADRKILDEADRPDSLAEKRNAAAKDAYDSVGVDKVRAEVYGDDDKNKSAASGSAPKTATTTSTKAESNR